MFAVCMALRLARFNAALEGAPRPAYAYNFFTGVPAPAGAGLALFPLFLGLEGQAQHVAWLVTLAQSPLFTAPVLAGTALLLRVHPAGLELQELQDTGRLRAADAARRRIVRRGAGGRPVGARWQPPG